MNRRELLRLGYLTVAGVAFGARRLLSEPMAFDFVLSGGTLVDGLGDTPRIGDLAVRDDRIVAVGELGELTGRAEDIVDVSGLFVCPGFVDLHSHSDWSLLACPTADSRIRQGITTEITGNCGSSAAPASSEGGTHDLPGYFAELESRRVAVNVALLVGQGTLRLRALGAEDRPATDGELARMLADLEEALDAGAFGLSTGLEYVPGIFTPAREIEALARVVALRGGLYASHLRNEESKVIAAVDEALAVARRTGVRTQLSHFKVVGRSHWPLQEETLRRLEEARRAGLDVAADVYPYAAYSTGLSILLPPWAREGGGEALRARLTDPAARDAIRDAVVHYVASDPGDFDRIVISSVGDNGRRDAVGRSLAQLAAGDGIAPAEALLRLLETAGDEVSFVGFGMNEDNVAKVLAHPLVAFGSDGYALRAEDGDTELPHPRSYGAAVRVLAHYCRDRQLLDLPTAVRKLTAFPADRAGLADRGRLLPGCFADLVVLDFEKLADRATFEDPKRYPTGIERVYVNGVAAVEDGEPTGRRAGRVLRRAS